MTSGEHTYSQILRSSAVIGAASVANILLGIVRTKLMAVMLGPAGFGVLSLYWSLLDLVASISAMGVGSSAVRQIAAEAGAEGPQRLGQIIVVLRRTMIIFGFLGAASLVLFARPLAIITFGSAVHTETVALIGLAVFFRVVYAGHTAIAQGLRRVFDLAVVGVAGTLLGTIVSVLVIYRMGEAGIAVAVVAAAAAAFLTSSVYVTTSRVPQSSVGTPDFAREAVALLKLGFAFMASGMLMLGASYAVRTMVVHFVGIDAAGLYQAAWTLGGLYVGVILQAMGADFYPRLVGVADDNLQCNRLVNEQTQVSLLLAGPGVVATLTLAHVAIYLFYTSEFTGAVELLRWICLGIALRVVTWPMGFIIIAKGKQLMFVLAELAWAVANIGLTFACIKWWGLNGAGIAFFGSYLFHGAFLYPMVRRLTGYSWSAANRTPSIVLAAAISSTFLAFQFLPSPVALAFGSVATIASGGYSLRSLLRLVELGSAPCQLSRLVERVLRIGRRNMDDPT